MIKQTYKPSAYNFFVEYESIHLAYNAISCVLAKFNSREYSIVQKIMKNPNMSNSISSKEEKIKNYLIRKKYLVPANINEIDTLSQRNHMGLYHSDTLELILMPTMDCNFNCFYCYEDHSSQYMTLETEEAIKLWATQEAGRFRHLFVSWFGGEPLLAYDTILRLSAWFHDLSQERRINFHNMITTNGYLLNKERVQELGNVNMRSFNITLDGSPGWHNRYRTHRDGIETFQTIRDNVITIADTIPEAKITIRVNYNKDNFISIPELFQLFPPHIRGKIFFLFRKIFGEAAEKERIKNRLAMEKEFYTQANRLGFQSDLSKNIGVPKKTFCHADRMSSYIINYNGEIFKCSVNKFESRNRVGILHRNGRLEMDSGKMEYWYSLPSFNKRTCSRCKFLPVCMGGCRSVRLSKETMENCQEPYYYFDEVIKNYYKMVTQH